MKIEKKELRKITKILKNIKYNPIFGDHIICFPIDSSKEKDIDGIQLNLVDNKFGSEKMPDPVILLQADKDEKERIFTTTRLAFCDTTYARKFDLLAYCDLLDISLSKKDKDVLGDIDCFLVAYKNILIGFEF